MADKLSPKISLSDLHTLEQLIDQAPARQPTAVSKRGAIGVLAPKLYALRARGYTWRDVAAWLTEHGLPVTAPSLQRSLRGVKVPAKSGARDRPAGARSKASHDGPTASPDARPSSVVATMIAPAPAQRAALPTGSLAMSSKTPVPEPEKRRSTFVPRPDSEEI